MTIVETGKSTGKRNKLVEKGQKTRNEILGASVNIASAEGLEGLTIGGLAKNVGRSKSGLFAHFGSKEGLQLATIERAGEIFAEEIILPLAGAKRGLGKLCLMMEYWISYVERSVFRGGCFFFAASAEMDDRPGKVRDFVSELTKVWVDALKDETREAVSRGELVGDCDIDLLVFQLHGFVQEANWFYRLHDDSTSFDLARRSVRHSLNHWATEEGFRVMEEINES